MTVEIRCKIKNANKSTAYKDLSYDIELINIVREKTKPFVDDCVKSFGDDPEKVSYSLHEVIQ